MILAIAELDFSWITCMLIISAITEFGLSYSLINLAITEIDFEQQSLK